MAYCGELKVSTAVDILLGPFLDDGDGDTADADAVLDVELSKNGQALADSESAAPSHDAAGTVDGYYNCILGTTDTNTLGLLTVVAHHADDLPVRQDYQVVTANYWDSKYSTDKLDVSIVQILGTAVAETTGANIATNFNTFFDDGDSAVSTAIMSYVEELAAANLVADVAACNTVTPDAAGVAATPAEVATALENINLHYLLKTTTGVAADADLEDYVVAGTVMSHVMAAGADVTNFKASTDSLEAIKVHADTIKAETAAIQVETTAIDVLTKAAGDGDLAAVLADTNELQADNYPTSIAAIKAETALIVADTNELQVDNYPTSIAAIKTVVDAVQVVTDNLAASATTLVSGTVSWDNTNATTTVIYSSDILEATADHYNGRIMIFTSGDLQNQATDITDYALDTGEGKFTVTALTEAPADNVTFVIV